MKNIKTTLMGLAAGIPVAADALISAYNARTFNGKTGTQLLISIAIVLLGYFSKDAKGSAEPLTGQK